MSTSNICTDERRRGKVRADDMNGLDYLEVISDDQRTFKVYFLGKAPTAIDEDNVIIQGGRRITQIKVLDADVKRAENSEKDDYMFVTVDKAGDFSTYTLRVVEVDHYEKGVPIYKDLTGFDKRYASLDFSFKAGCPSDLDCKNDEVCPPELRVEPEINYLAKDYASFRQVILDRLALTIPGWQERHVPDIGITLVEILAYVGDYLSYYQDAVATEAYLETARQRISVRRHARLVDYTLHEGCNARSWLFMQTSEEQTSSSTQKLYPSDLYFITGSSDDVAVTGTMLTESDVLRLPVGSYEVFEVLVAEADKNCALEFYKAHNEIHLYTWGDKDCCLPKGTTSATLADFEPTLDENEPEDPDEEDENSSGNQDEQRQQSYVQGQSSDKNVLEAPKSTSAQRILHLKEGNYLLFEEIMGAKTGVPEDADRTHRHVVRLTKVTEATDDLYHKNVLEIEWSAEDTLPFPLCISAIGSAPFCKQLENISVARGNILLVDYGLTVQPDEPLATVQEDDSTASCEGPNQPADVTISALPYRTHLKQTPLTYSESLPTTIVSAKSLLIQDVRKALPHVTLSSTISNAQPSQKWTWLPQSDLLESNGEDRHFVVEMDNDGFAQLRFGNDELGRAPQVHEGFTAHYRIGNGPLGNVGAETITRVVLRHNITLSGIVFTPRNPLPAQGGTSQELLTEAKLFAPRAFRTQLKRAITAEDYAQLAQDHPKVQRAAASLRWNGSGYTVLVVIDPFGTEDVDQTLLDEIGQHLEEFRRIGHDIIVHKAEYVPLEIVMNVCVRPHYLRGHVKAALLTLFSNRVQLDGTLGFFHPDNLSFGDNIAVSTLVAKAQAVPGVLSVIVEKLQRFGEVPHQELRNGVLPIGSLEVAKLDNDPSFPEHGTITFTMTGGR